MLESESKVYVEMGSVSAPMQAKAEITGAETKSEEAGVQRGDGILSWRKAEMQNYLCQRESG